MKRKVLAVLFELSLEKLAVKHDPVDSVDDTGRLGIVRLKYFLIPIQIEERTCPIEGKVEDLEMVYFKISGMNPVGRMGSAHDDHIGLDLGMKGFVILQRKMGIGFLIHPEIHQNQDGEKNEQEKKNLSIG